MTSLKLEPHKTEELKTPTTHDLKTPKTRTQLLEEQKKDRRKAVFGWLRERTIQDSEALTRFSGPKSLHEDYINYCTLKGLTPESMKALSRYVELYLVSEHGIFLIRKRNYYGTLIPGLKLRSSINEN